MKAFMKKWLALVIIFGILILLIGALCIYVYAASGIRYGVRCADISLGGMSCDSAVSALDAALGEDYDGGKITLLIDGNTRYVYTRSFDVSYSYEDTAKSALKFGHEGGFFTRCRETVTALLFGHELPLKLTYDAEKLKEETQFVLEGTGTPVSEYSYEIIDDRFWITNGMPGDMPDQNEVMASILEVAAALSFSEPLVFEKQERLPAEINVEKLHEEVYAAMANAYYERTESGVAVIAHKYGVDFDKTQAEKIVKSNKGYGKTFEIPAQISTPDLLEQDAIDRLFAKTLGTYKSHFNSGDVSRSSNIYLASGTIDGTILMPGESFSYNGVVGKRTPEAGYKMANVYINNEIDQDYGGGICQVSSTLYCAVLYANLEVNERVNHQIAVSYVPLGQDATVDWGNIDFRFTNNTGYPLKIVSNAAGSSISMSLLGYKDINEVVEITPVHISSIAPAEIEEEDPELPLGEREIVSQGAAGSVVETYKTVTTDGVRGQRTFISRSRYAAGKTKVKVGTKPLEEIEESPLSETPDTASPLVPTPSPASPSPESSAPVSGTTPSAEPTNTPQEEM